MNYQATDYRKAIELVEDSYDKMYTPPPDLTMSEWADTYLYLSPEDSAEPGKYQVDRAPYQRGMLDAVSDSTIKEVVYCTSSQIGKTLMAKAILGYYISQDPGPILVMQPTVGVAETFSKDRLAPMIRDTPVLTGLIADPKSRNSGNTIDKKSFPGGHITMIGANAPTELASRPIRIVFADEVDRYPVSAGSEGDPIFLARQRSVTFWNRKMIMASTPTIAGLSRIWKAFENSDQRYYYLPCPHCGEFHTLKWAQMVWQDGEASTAMMACPICGAMYGDADKLKMLTQGEWRAMQPNNPIAGFHISALYSPWQTFSDVVGEWLLKKDNPETLKTFINLQLGECWEDRSGESIKPDTLISRRETWDSVPADVVTLTAGVDVQDDRLEISVIGWTGEEQSRVLHHNKLYGPPGEPAVWAQLDAFLMAEHFTADGRILRIKATAIDSGGHHTQQAYEFCRSRIGQRVVPIKGRKGAFPIWPTRSSKTKMSKGLSLFLVGVDTARDSLRSALAVRDPALPRYVAFSSELTEDYFKQLTNEKRVLAYSKTGSPTRVWKKVPGARYEALDCYVYAIAALEYLKQSGLKLKNLARVIRPTKTESPIVEQNNIPKPVVRVKPKQRTSSAIQ